MEEVQIMSLADISNERKDVVFPEARPYRSKPTIKVRAPPNLMSKSLTGRFKRVRVDNTKGKEDEQSRGFVLRSSTAPAFYNDLCFQQPQDNTQRVLDQVYLANVYGIDQIERNKESAVNRNSKVTINEDVDIESVFEAPLDFIMQTVKNSRMQRLNDIAVGITPGRNKSRMKQSRNKSRESVEKKSMKFRTEDMGTGVNKTSEPKLSPSWSPFTKFRQPTLMRNQTNLQDNISSGKRKPLVLFNTPLVTNTVKKTIPGRLFTNKFPVTEALNKNGKSLTKQKGKILQKGECTVAKVWERRLSNTYLLSPYQMAKEDSMNPILSENMPMPSLDPVLFRHNTVI